MGDPKPGEAGGDLWEKQAAARDGTNGFLAPPTPPAAPAKKAAKKRR